MHVLRNDIFVKNGNRVDLVVKSGLQAGSFAILIDDDSEHESLSKGRLQTYKNVSLVQLDTRISPSNDVYFNVVDKTQKFLYVVVHEDENMYEIHYTNLDPRVVYTKYVDAENRVINDLDFYGYMLKLKKKLQANDIEIAKNDKDLPLDNYVVDFVDCFMGGRNPFIKGAKLSGKQREDFLNFVDVMAESIYTNDFYELGEKYHEVMKLAKNAVRPAREKWEN